MERVEELRRYLEARIPKLAVSGSPDVAPVLGYVQELADLAKREVGWHHVATIETDALDAALADPALGDLADGPAKDLLAGLVSEPRRTLVLPTAPAATPRGAYQPQPRHAAA